VRATRKETSRRYPKFRTGCSTGINLTPTDLRSETLEQELQKIYDSEINVTLRTGDKDLFVALGNDFTGFSAEGNLVRVADVIPWFQNAIHAHYPFSKYDVERLGGTFTPEMAEIPDGF